MTSEHYLKSFQKVGEVLPIYNSIFLIVKECQEQSKSKLIQRAVVQCGHKIDVDGIIGSGTVKAICMSNPVSFLTVLGVLLRQSGSPEVMSHKEVIIGYLSKAEGTHLHWNRTEKTFTTPLGVYALHHPRSAPVLFILRLSKSHGIRVVRKNMRKIDALITDDMRAELFDLVYEFYVKEYTDNRINKHLGPLSALSFFSNSVNGGKRRGVVTLQRALGVDDDGIVGSGTISALVGTSMSDVALNNKMGAKMWQFYKYLANKNKKRYGLYLNGWRNRLVGLKVNTEALA